MTLTHPDLALPYPSTYSDRSQRASVSDIKIRGSSFSAFRASINGGLKERRSMLDNSFDAARKGATDVYDENDNLPLPTDSASITVSRLLTNQAFYQKLLREGNVFSCCDSAMQAALRR